MLTCQRQFPDYYDTIKHPMALDFVHAKLEKKEYSTLKEVTTDFGQIWNNAKRCKLLIKSWLTPDNVKESVLFQWAKRLHVSLGYTYR